MKLLQALIVIAFSSYTTSETNVVDGWDASITDYPYQAGVLADDAWCGGSLISETWILTAAHCVDSINDEDIFVYLGSNERMGGTERSVNSKIVHPEYASGTWFNDVALLEIDSVDYSDTIRNVVLADSDETFDGEPVITTGWGQTGDDGFLADSMLAGQMVVISNSECAETFGSIVDSKLCAKPPDGGATSICFGDSGGPLVLNSNKVQVGISSFIYSDSCEKGKPSGFARVSSYRQWIRENCGV